MSMVGRSVARFIQGPQITFDWEDPHTPARKRDLKRRMGKITRRQNRLFIEEGIREEQEALDVAMGIIRDFELDYDDHDCYYDMPDWLDVEDAYEPYDPGYYDWDDGQDWDY